jgi:hypothetical protein
MSPIQQQLQQTQAMVARFAVTSAANNVKDYLSDLGMDGAAEDPHYRRLFADALQKTGLPIDRWDNTDEETLHVLESAASFAIPTYRRYLKENGKDLPKKGSETTASNGNSRTLVEQANRNSLKQIGSTRGETVDQNGFTPEEVQGADDMTFILKRSRNPVTPAEYRAMQNEDELKKFRSEQQRKAAKR